MRRSIKLQMLTIHSYNIFHLFSFRYNEVVFKVIIQMFGINVYGNWQMLGINCFKVFRCENYLNICFTIYFSAIVLKFIIEN